MLEIWIECLMLDLNMFETLLSIKTCNCKCASPLSMFNQDN
uniref:Uncharacterized protein n=1 Tax=Rhizophora mucronata TaxID=61149 RepID=A0A2P2QXL6_RHIMU